MRKHKALRRGLAMVVVSAAICAAAGCSPLSPSAYAARADAGDPTAQWLEEMNEVANIVEPERDPLVMLAELRAYLDESVDARARLSTQLEAVNAKDARLDELRHRDEIARIGQRIAAARWRWRDALRDDPKARAEFQNLAGRLARNE